MVDDDAGDGRHSHVAIVGLACRFPGASTPDAFWDNLRDSRESITFFSEHELNAAGVEASLLANPAYVKAGAVLSDIEHFDASFFGFTPREAEVLDVQQRIFLECAWQALEDAGINPDDSNRVCGLFAGSGPNTYLLNNLLPNRDLLSAVGWYQLMLANDKDYLSTRVAYKLNLRGPAVTVQTACSTSLVAVHLACQSLLTGECDVAIAGGVSVSVPHRRGYLHQDGMIVSPDGHCRAFDRLARGTVGGSGAGAVVLTRLEAAMQRGDRVRAVIRGSAVNNDGTLKAGYTAPSVSGQSTAIAEALAVAGLTPTDISYLEAHGTATPLGDPIEVAALKEVFGRRSGSSPWCALGSVKTNIGHVDTAAGVAGLIKTVLALEHRQLPASLHFEEPNPALELSDTPFYVNARPADWPAADRPRRAGVSSFGIGGTNAHVVVEEAPRLDCGSSTRPAQLVVLSAKTATARVSMAGNLAEYLRKHPQVPLADVAYTLSTGRKTFAHRMAIVCGDTAAAAQALSGATPGHSWSAVTEATARRVAFTFCGQGLQYPNLTAGLYAAEPFFRERVDYCASVLQGALGLDIRAAVFGGSADLTQTALSQPVLFTVQYAIAKLWMHWGVEPRALLGHSLGEYVAACLGGVFSLDDALLLVAERGRLMQQLPPGAMLSIPLGEEDTLPLLTSHLSVAAINTADSCVVAGPVAEVDALQDRLARQGLDCPRVRTSHAFHSSMMDPIVGPFADRVARLSLRPPQIPFVSCATGTWIRDDDAQNPEYWAQQLRQTVRYVDGVRCLLASDAAVFVEAGPSQGLESVCRHLDPRCDRTVVQSVRHPKNQATDVDVLLGAVARLWLAGGRVEWEHFYGAEQRRRVSLPTYPFERQRYWVEASSQSESASDTRLLDRGDWFYVPSWKRSTPSRMDPELRGGSWLVFLDRCGVGARLIQRLGVDRQRIIAVETNEALVECLMQRAESAATIVHLWNVSREASPPDSAFFSLLSLGQLLATRATAAPTRLFVISNNLHQVAGEDTLSPEKATLLGPVTVLPKELDNISARSLDVVLPPPDSRQERELIDQLTAEMLSAASDPIVAFRDGHRWVPALEPVHLDRPSDGARAPDAIRFHAGGVYLITGGLGGIGLTLAEYLARAYQARLVLASRRPVPAREDMPALRLLEELGSEVMVVSADVTDLGAMREVCRTACQRFGAIDGVIHAAGVAGGGVIELKTREVAEHVLAPKVTGALVLGELAREFRFGFLVFCSSLTSLAPEFGQVDYVAANAFLDAYVPFLRRHGVRAVGVNWDTWQRVGMAARTPVPRDLAAAREWELAQAIAPEDGPDLLERIAASGLSRVVVSTRRPDLRMRRAEPQAPRAAAPPQTRASHPRPTLATPYTAPQTDLQRRIVDDWQQVLGIAPIGIFDSFFDLGGHSLLAIQLISRVAAAQKVHLTLTSFFEHPTIDGMAALVDGLASSISAPDVALGPAPPARDADADIPLSLSQQQLWIADQVEPGTARYNEFGIHVIDGPLNVDALQRSFDEIVRRHEVLRTAFPLRDGSPVQRVSPPAALPICCADVSSVAESERLREAHRIAEQEARTPFDLSSGPLLRVTLIRLAAESHWLTLTIHHIVFDGWSGAVFIRELLQLYEAFANDVALSISDPPMQYADFSLWQHDSIDADRRSRQLAYWRNQLAGAQFTVALPYDRRPSGTTASEGRRVNFALNPELSRRLKTAGQRLGATPFTTLLASYAVLLHRYTGQEDLVIGTPVANRKWQATEQMIGYFVNTLPIRVDLRGSPRFVDLLVRLQRAVLEGQEHSDVTAGGRLPVLFVFRNATNARLHLPRGIRVRELEYDAVPARSDLDMYVFETETQLSGYFVYPVALFERSSIERMARRFETLVTQVLDRPEASIADLPRERPPALAGPMRRAAHASAERRRGV